MFSFVPKLENIDEAIVQMEVALALLKKSQVALKEKRQAQKMSKDALKAMTKATVAMFGKQALVPMDSEEMEEIAYNGRITLIVSIPFNELACISNEESLDGLNDWVDTEVGGCLSDINYRAIAVDHENDSVFFEVNGEV